MGMIMYMVIKKGVLKQRKYLNLNVKRPKNMKIK